MRAYRYCIVACVSETALTAILDNGGRGAYRDNHPWLFAKELLHSAGSAGTILPLILATGSPLELAHWGRIDEIDVDELHRGSWETRCDFGALSPVSPIFTALDSLMLKPGDDALRREQLEGVRPWRHPLDERHIRPYAICETPAFIDIATGEKEQGSVV
ncbi:MAG: hypothetical protein NT024_11680 [Proteobacteria bacterium]|jgi:hypothetical protein|nr:hypothetical protein [Pseudomonadota bacterium]